MIIIWHRNQKPPFIFETFKCGLREINNTNPINKCGFYMHFDTCTNEVLLQTYPTGKSKANTYLIVPRSLVITCFRTCSTCLRNFYFRMLYFSLCYQFIFTNHWSQITTKIIEITNSIYFQRRACQGLIQQQF